ncbi:MAG: hypothetical protein JST20_11180 [Bacteroidetes bacterium]|nr:hypothetical protein [Bacteroidota bacterium]
MKEVYACIWRATEPDETFNPEEFQSRIPRLMEWLRTLKAGGHLLGCGGGGFATHPAGLTLISAESVEEAQELSAGTPMNEIGTTEIMLWDVFYADLSVLENTERLVPSIQ